MNLAKLGSILILIGFLIVFIAILLPMLTVTHRGGATEIGGGGCIVIFFIPICFGYGAPHLVLPLLIVSIALTIIMLITGLIVLRESRRIIKNMEIV